MPLPKGANAPSSHSASARRWNPGRQRVLLRVCAGGLEGPRQQLYFATYGGVLEIDPARLIVGRPPAVLIEGVTDDRQKPMPPVAGSAPAAI